MVEFDDQLLLTNFSKKWLQKVTTLYNASKR